jgi:CHAT domain-containing protein/Tfp pilus assembly protein PilF
LTGRGISLQAGSEAEAKTLFQEYYQVRRLLAEKRYEDAVRKSRRLIERSPSFQEIYPDYAGASRAGGKMEESIRELLQLVNRKGANPFIFYGLAICQFEQKDSTRAAEYYKKAIEAGADFIWPYYYLVALSAKPQWEELRKYFAGKAESEPHNSFIHYGLGVLYEFKLKDYTLALASYEKALSVARETARIAEEAKHLNTIGNLYWGRGQYAKALDFFEQALKSNEKYEDKAERARFLGNCGLMNCYLGDVVKGREYYLQALENDRGVGQRLHEASMHRGIGFTYFRQSDYPQALRYYEQALRLAREYADKGGEGRYLTDIASVHWSRGNFTEAIEFHKRALGISEEVGDRYNQGMTLQNIGGIYWTTGDFSKALEYLHRAIKTNRESGFKANEAGCLNDIGLIHEATGDFARALEHYNLALRMWRESGDKSGQGIGLNNISNVYARQGEYAESLSYQEQAIQIARETGNKKSIANRLNNAALNQGKMGNYKAALSQSEEALKIAGEVGARDVEVLALLNKGYIHTKLDNPAAARSVLKQALSLSQAIGLHNLVWRAYWHLAEAYERLGEMENALANYRQSIEAIESLRGQLQIEEQKAGFLGSRIEVYEGAASALFSCHQRNPSAGYDRECFALVEKARARAFLDSLEEVKINLRAGLTPEQQDEENGIRKAISALHTELLKPEMTGVKREELLGKLETAETEYALFIQRMRRENQAFARLVLPETASLEEVQTALPDDRTALLEYFIGDQVSLLFCLTKREFSVNSLPAGKALLEKAADYTKLLSNKGNGKFQAQAAGRSLYQDLLGPVTGRMASVEKLIIVPDGSLHYLPFEALVRDSQVKGSGAANENRFLARDYRVCYAPSASSLLSLLERRREEEPQRVLLAFADPIYELGPTPGKRLSSDELMREFYLAQGFDLYSLPHTGEEIKKISRILKAGSKNIYTREKAKEEKLKETSLHDFKIIHFATHGLLDERSAMKSALVLSLDEDPREDGFFQAREIWHSRINADLVVLSACQTGKGKLERGEGVSGLARAFLHAGARCVLATLWNVNDKATAEFMGDFYEYLKEGKSQDAALHLAKVRMMDSSHGHPFFWAGFVLNGDSEAPIRLGK